MLGRSFKDLNRETWVDPDPTGMGGFSTITVTTDLILPNDQELDHVEAYCYVDAVLGSPSVDDPVVTRNPVTGQVIVNVTNSALPGNSCAYTVDVRYNHSILGC